MNKFFFMLCSFIFLISAQDTIQITVQNNTDGQLHVGFGMMKLNAPCTQDKLIPPFTKTVNAKNSIAFMMNKACCGSFPKFIFKPITGSARKTGEYELSNFNCQNKTITVSNSSDGGFSVQ